MRHAEIVRLIEKGIRPGETAWADLGSGDGAFTLALRKLLGPDADIYSVDADGSRLARQARAFRSGPGAERTTFVEADFTDSLALPPLDGVLMANALHFVEDQAAFLARLRRGGSRATSIETRKLLIVEYDITRGSSYVPYPVSYARLTELALEAGFGAPALLGTARSRYWSRIYSALIPLL
jgi:ubiquinone/menaquinone biosynthesis C-methylase UbiE